MVKNMIAKRTTMRIGWRVYGLGVIGLSVVCVWADYLLGQTLPKDLPGRIALGYAAGVFLLLVGAAMEWRRTVAWGAAALTVFSFLVVLAMDIRPIFTSYKVYGAYSQVAYQLVLTVGGLIVYAESAKIDAALAERLTRVGQITFGICALLYGGAHFVYMNLTAPLIPKWLPPTQVFWGYATGVCFILAGLAILVHVKARLAAILLTVMLGCFTILVHIRGLVADHSGFFNWSELALNFACVGVAWVVAESYGPARTAGVKGVVR
jgi:uncharacterized membrane protein